jgi:guanylate kinase
MVDLVTIRKRIIKRGNENKKEISIRMGRVAAENRRAKDYDYVVENPEGHPDVAINRVLEIIESELNNK